MLRSEVKARKIENEKYEQRKTKRKWMRSAEQDPNMRIIFQCIYILFSLERRRIQTEWKRLSGRYFFCRFWGTKSSKYEHFVRVYIVYRIYYYRHFSWAIASINGKAKCKLNFKKKRKPKQNDFEMKSNHTQTPCRNRTQSAGKIAWEWWSSQRQHVCCKHTASRTI